MAVVRELMSYKLNIDDFKQLDIFCWQLVVCGRKHAYVDLELWLISRRQSPIFHLPLVLSRRKGFTCVHVELLNLRLGVVFISD